MSKKSHRRHRKTAYPRLSPAQMIQPGEQTAPTKPVAVSPTVSRAPARVLRDLREEYPYVAADLKRIAIIAAVMLVVLIGLALLLV